MSAEGHSTKVVVTGLAVNGTIAIAKGIAAAVSGSGSMLAEAIHTASDCLNQILLLIGLKQAAAGASEKHPLGTGRASYFWSFLVALMLFFGGGVFSIGEGVEKILHKEPVHNIGLGIGVLIFSLVLESAALAQCLRELDKKRGTMPRSEYLKITNTVSPVKTVGERTARRGGTLAARQQRAEGAARKRSIAPRSADRRSTERDWMSYPPTRTATGACDR
ncbi:MAG: cation transporter [Polyangiales bacterium]